MLDRERQGPRDQAVVGNNPGRIDAQIGDAVIRASDDVIQRSTTDLCHAGDPLSTLETSQ